MADHISTTTVTPQAERNSHHQQTKVSIGGGNEWESDGCQKNNKGLRATILLSPNPQHVAAADDPTAGAWGWSSEELEQRVEGGRVRPSYGQGRYGVVPPRALDIVAMCVMQIRLIHHTIGRRNPRRFPPNAASVDEHCDGHCGSETKVGWEGGDRKGGWELYV